MVPLLLLVPENALSLLRLLAAGRSPYRRSTVPAGMPKWWVAAIIGFGAVIAGAILWVAERLDSIGAAAN